MSDASPECETAFARVQSVGYSGLLRRPSSLAAWTTEREILDDYPELESDDFRAVCRVVKLLFRLAEL